MHSLQYLSLGNGLSSSLSQLPSDVFENLTALEFLDLSNNGLRNIPQKLFHAMKRLKIILLQDNFIEFIPERAFQVSLGHKLKKVFLNDFTRPQRDRNFNFWNLKRINENEN